MSTRRPPSSTAQLSSKQSRKSKQRPRLSPSELSYKISTFFSPTLFPRLPPAPPSLLSLAYSRLPPPCAELDPAPTYRIRRFKLWRNQVVDLRKIVLDHRLRGHLVRYQTYALPNTSHWSRGVQRKVFPRGPQIKDYSAWPKLSSIRNPKWGRKASPGPPQGDLNTSLSPSPSSARPPAVPQSVKLSGPERRKRRERLKQHRWVLHAENERRWRQCMREIMADVVYFQEGCMLDASKWRDGVGVWLPDFNLDEVIQWTNTFRDIRRRPDRVFDLCTDVPRVKGRAEADGAIKANEAERKARKTERRQNRISRSEATSEKSSQAPTPSLNRIDGDASQASQTKNKKGNKSDRLRCTSPKPASRPKTDSPADGSSCRPPQSVPSARRTSTTPSSGPLIDSEKPVRSTRPERNSRMRSDHRRSLKTPSEKQVADCEPAEPAKCMTKEDTSTLFRLLQHVADLQTRRDDVTKRIEVLEKSTAQKANTRSGTVGLDEQEDNCKSVTSCSSKVLTGSVERSARSDKRGTAKKWSSGDERHARSGPLREFISSSSTIPSIASSATAIPTHRSLRPGSLYIDDDTLHPPATPSDMSVTMNAEDEVDVEDLDVDALQVLIRGILAERS